MDGKELLLAIGDIDSTLIEEAAQKRHFNTAHPRQVDRPSGRIDDGDRGGRLTARAAPAAGRAGARIRHRPGGRGHIRLE